MADFPNGTSDTSNIWQHFSDRLYGEIIEQGRLNVNRGASFLQAGFWRQFRDSEMEHKVETKDFKAGKLFNDLLLVIEGRWRR